MQRATASDVDSFQHIEGHMLKAVGNMQLLVRAAWLLLERTEYSDMVRRRRDALKRLHDCGLQVHLVPFMYNIVPLMSL